jgi:hypothetical protein
MKENPGTKGPLSAHTSCGTIAKKCFIYSLRINQALLDLPR